MTWYVFLGIEEVVVESVFAPQDFLFSVGFGVGEAGDGARGAAKEAVQVRALTGGDRIEASKEGCRRQTCLCPPPFSGT